MSRNTRTILISVLATLLVILILQNLKGISVRFVVWDLAMPVAVLVLLAFAGGWLGCWFWRRK